jgi:hypothetical protein
VQVPSDCLSPWYQAADMHSDSFRPRLHMAASHRRDSRVKVVHLVVDGLHATSRTCIHDPGVLVLIVRCEADGSGVPYLGAACSTYYTGI